jgi:hypothetical protein
LQVAKTDKVIAKDRTDALDDLIRDPSLPDIWEAIHSNS